MAVRRQEALDYHSQGRPGKIQIALTKPCKTQRDLSLAYTPGVAEPCLDIEKNPDDAYKYTARGNLVAVVSNGTAVLGLGNIGPLAGKPVMEGKGVLFKAFADIDVFDLEIQAPTPAEIIRFCQMLEPTVGGINLEDIKAPDCFEVEEQLIEALDIPVFHDDQHGTAIISGAALVNAVELDGQAMADIKVVFSGAGASAIATANHYIRLGVKREHITHRGHARAWCTPAAPTSTSTSRRSPARPTRGTSRTRWSAPTCSSGSRWPAPSRRRCSRAWRPSRSSSRWPTRRPRSCRRRSRAARPDAIIATGRSDYPNQVNNVLGFPFIFRGALDVRARTINEEMKMAATHALADAGQAGRARRGAARLRRWTGCTSAPTT